MKCRITRNVLGRWILTHPDSDGLAWSGSRWVTIDPATGLGAIVQVSNLATEDEAYDYAMNCGFTTIVVA